MRQTFDKLVGYDKKMFFYRDTIYQRGLYRVCNILLITPTLAKMALLHGPIGYTSSLFQDRITDMALATYKPTNTKDYKKACKLVLEQASLYIFLTYLGYTFPKPYKGDEQWMPTNND